DTTRFDCAIATRGTPRVRVIAAPDERAERRVINGAETDIVFIANLKSVSRCTCRPLISPDQPSIRNPQTQGFVRTMVTSKSKQFGLAGQDRNAFAFANAQLQR